MTTEDGEALRPLGADCEDLSHGKDLRFCAGVDEAAHPRDREGEVL
jgi:hypothetical protein